MEREAVVELYFFHDFHLTDVSGNRYSTYGNGIFISHSVRLLSISQVEQQSKCI